jgi:hypothetical protein
VRRQSRFDRRIGFGGDRNAREGYSANQIQGPLLKRQLTVLIKAARPEPLDRDLSRGVRGN